VNFEPAPLRVLHVVALLTEDGRYGGPQRVALDVAQAQRAKGLEVLVLSGGVKDSPLSATDGVKAFRIIRLFPRLGYAGMLAPGMLIWLIRHRNEFDVAHIHLARDLITLPVAVILRGLGQKYVLQTHGMVDQASNLLARLLDVIAVRTVLRNASAVLSIAASEAEDIRKISPRARIRLLNNGIALAAPLKLPRTKVTFLARMHPRKGGRIFAEAAVLISHQYPEVTFVMAGPDEGDLEKIVEVRAGNGDSGFEVIGPLPAASIPALMATSIAYVLPAPNEPFGMTVLEAMAEETPVILDRSAELAKKLRREECLLTFDGTAADLAKAMTRLLEDETLARSLGRRGREVAERRFDLAVVAQDITSSYF
jgi:glycosyltransferase involved in cell wall biosynthesis